MRTLLATAAIVLESTTLFAACVGADPAPYDVGGSLDAATLDASTDVPLADAGVPEYGAFLTTTTYRSDFESGAGDIRAFVDRICAAAAASADLADPTSYHAIIAVRSGADATLDANLLQPYTAASAGRWCAIAPGPSPRPNCNGSNLLFSTPGALVTGPEQSLITDERGLAQASGGLFLSGLHMPDDASSGVDIRVADCASWSVADGGDQDAGGELAAGTGSVRHVSSPEVDYRWLGREPSRPCDATSSLPLLCLQRPTTP